ncbi:MAG TPA: GAF domain-containing protein [Geobacteraceae bacterium]|nr:GAF domain-containing protein [Geobacteraceae bacterium]
MKLDEFCTILDKFLSGEQSYQGRLETAVRLVSRAFNVKPDEVAILLIDEKGETLGFAWPPHLKEAGIIPLSATNPLVAKTARENRGFLNNTFAVTPHASFFEKFRDKGNQPLPIQKIMSVPLAGSGTIKGVLQVSRKGQDPASAGADFSKNELLALEKIASLIAAHL